MSRTTLEGATRSLRPRLFFALCPDEEVRERLMQVQASVEAGAARAVIPDNLHLTLAFLGEVAAGARECYAQAAGTIEIPRFDLALERFGYFDRRSLCWLGPSVTPVPLRTLHRRLQHAILPCGYQDRSRFRPHVTLFRKAVGLTMPDATPMVEWQVDRFFLVESVRKNEGVVYVPIEEYR